MGPLRVGRPTKLQPELDELVSVLLLDGPRAAFVSEALWVDLLPRSPEVALEPIKLVRGQAKSIYEVLVL